jgi:hypothetical protein
MVMVDERQQTEGLPSSDVMGHQPVDERVLRSVRLHYQSNHQEEFLRLKAQVESLLSEIQTHSVP